VAQAAHTYQVGDLSIEISNRAYRTIVNLLKSEKRIEAVLELKNETGQDMRTAKVIVKQIETHLDDQASIDHCSLGPIESLKAVLSGHLQFGKWVQAHQHMLIVCIVVVWLSTLAVIGLTSMPQTANATPQTAWFYDLNTGELFEASYAIPPIATSSGKHDGEPAGVMAYVFSCGKCSADQRYIGWLETRQEPGISAAALEAEQELKPGTPLLLQEASGTMIRRVDDKQWYPIEGEAAQHVMDEALSKCDSAEPIRCSAG